MDANRADDGVALRRVFTFKNGIDTDISEYIDGPSSVLEMMLSLSIRIEELMDDPKIGDRTGQWFWQMIVNLGLGSMTDNRFDAKKVDEIIVKFLERKYEPDGRGNIFYIRNCDYDLRTIDLWVQMLWYLNSIG